MKHIHIYTLAEGRALFYVLCNFLGYAPTATYDNGAIIKKATCLGREEILKGLLAKVSEKRGELHVRHIFKPFVEPSQIVDRRKYNDNSVMSLRAITKTKDLKIVWEFDWKDEETLSEIKTLRNFSPPLYDKLFKDKMTPEKFDTKWGSVSVDNMSDEQLEEFKNDCFELYELTGFLDEFNSPYDEHGEHNGMTFKVLRRATKHECDIEALPLWEVLFENGDKALCYPEEICRYEKNTK